MGTVEIVDTNYYALDSEAVFSYATQNLSKHQLENCIADLIFMISSELRDQGAVAEARAYDAMFTHFRGGTNKIDAQSFYNLWLRAGYLPTWTDLIYVLGRWK